MGIQYLGYPNPMHVNTNPNRLIRTLTGIRNHSVRADWTRSIDAFMASAALYVSLGDIGEI